MDGYPPEYISHNLPLIVLSGLGSPSYSSHDGLESSYPLLEEKGTRISSNLPSVSGTAADELLGCFLELDAKDLAWNNRPGKGKLGTMTFRIQSAGRDCILPPRKANPPSSSPSSSLSDLTQTQPRKFSLIPSLHSPLSPLTPGFSTFPDGIMTPLWIMKHQALIPSTFISFFNFSVDPNSSTLEDNKLKTEINAVRTAFTSSSYKIRLVVILISPGGVLESDIDDRIANIRRGTGLDPKNSLFFIPSDSSLVELRAFVGTVLSSVQPQCMEYYRDLSKHTRRKRNRGSVPPPTAPPTLGTSQTLTAQGWNVRYEFKLGVFAEFRQEMDAAGRNYEAAYESLLGDEVFESIVSWSPRFDEARLLADVLAIRILRCLLWTSQTTSAVQSWSNHRSRMQDLVDRKGKGSETYGWEAWEARWSTVMAEMIEKVDVPIFQIPEQPDARFSKLPVVFANPEKAVPIAERLLPWDMLHHQGYWFSRAAQRTLARRKLALAIPEEDRSPPGQSQASQALSRSHLYDTYLCPEPHVEYPLSGHDTFDHTELLVRTWRKSASDFAKRQQSRAVAVLELEMAQEYMKVGRWNDAMNILRPLWQKLSWRRAGWWNLVGEVGWALRQCARQTGDGETLVAVEWELLSDSLPLRPSMQYDFPKCLEGIESIKDKPHVVIQSGDTAHSLSTGFAFGVGEGNVGASISSQLTITSRAHKSSSPITVSRISITFEGGLRDIEIEHDADESSGATTTTGPVHFHDASLREPSRTEMSSLSSSQFPRASHPLLVSSNLTFLPGITRVFSLACMPRDAGEVAAAKVTIDIQEQAFQLTVISALEDYNHQHDWWYKGKAGLQRKKLGVDRSHIVNVLPKPPRMQIELPTIRETYYTNERVELIIKITNQEDVIADITLDVRLSGQSEAIPAIKWSIVPGEIESYNLESGEETTSSQANHISAYPLGKLGPSESWQQSLWFQAMSEMTEYTLEIKAFYHLSSDPNTPVSKTTTTNLAFISPFEASYEFSPRLHPDPWPSYFYLDWQEQEPSSESVEDRTAKGLTQRWSLTGRIVSLAIDSLLIEGVRLYIVEVKNGALCSVSQEGKATSGQIALASNGTLEHWFTLDVQKMSLEDRRSSAVVLHLDVTWRRSSADPVPTTTSLLVQQLLVPFGEPRVLASSTVSHIRHGLMHLDYTLENPSTHILTFSLIMEASEDFAFSGPKATTVQLVPLSRHVARYNILPSVKGKWIQVILRVVDVGFNKTLKVSATEGMRVSGKGVLIWVDADG